MTRLEFAIHGLKLREQATACPSRGERARPGRGCAAGSRGRARGPSRPLASPPPERPLHAAVGIALVVSVGTLFAVPPLITLATHAVNALPF
jgi:hypothetical protein